MSVGEVWACQKAFTAFVLPVMHQPKPILGRGGGKQNPDLFASDFLPQFLGRRAPAKLYGLLGPTKRALHPSSSGAQPLTHASLGCERTRGGGTSLNVYLLSQCVLVMAAVCGMQGGQWVDSAVCSMQSAQCAWSSLQCAELHCVMHSVHHAQQCAPCTMCTAEWAMCSLQLYRVCSVQSVHCAVVLSAYCAMCRQCAECRVCNAWADTWL